MPILDQLAKAIVKALLQHVAQVETNCEIPGHVLVADLWIKPEPARGDDMKALGVLGRMVADGPCLIEPFSSAPRASEIRSCILKQYSLDHAQRRDARTQGRRAPPFPRLWIIAAGRPDSVIEAMGLSQMDGWPPGFLGARPFHSFCIAVLRELPRTPETLFLRLLSRDDMLREAARELATVPDTVPELAKLADLVVQVFVVFRKELNQDQQEDEDMEALRDIEAAYKKWERHVKAEAAAKATAEANRATLIKAIQALCHRCEIELSDERLLQLAQWHTEELEDVLVELGASHEWPAL